MANSTIALSQSELDVVRPIELSFALPRSYGTRIYLRLTIRAKFILLFLTTAQDGDSVAASLGSFVFALPDHLNPGQSISTPLYIDKPSLDFSSRLAKFLARKYGKAVYVGNSISFASTGMGGTVEEELEGFKKVVDVVTHHLNHEQK
ncbi:hypothetical protein EV44_g6081 [Erysiphe necator]|uniref:20s proteasome chaperone domain-containing protein n=1 Tax=Uncinula necator TaxID=52586 RepID=A0A0B1PAI9_UNCNE|nr:hypothetical protein EV44_g6081 [Erysiphe necator]